VLHLPDVAELMDNQVVGGLRHRRPQHDRGVERVPVEPLEIRQPEKPGGREDADVSCPDRAWIEVEPVEALASPLERSARLRAHCDCEYTSLWVPVVAPVSA